MKARNLHEIKILCLCTRQCVVISTKIACLQKFFILALAVNCTPHNPRLSLFFTGPSDRAQTSLTAHHSIAQANDQADGAG